MAPRLTLSGFNRRARGALAMVCLGVVSVGLAIPATAEHVSVCVEGDGDYIRQACYVDAHGPVAYGHGVLGDTPEWDELHIFWGAKKPKNISNRTVSAVLEARHVFEDLAPRIQDLDGDGFPEIIAVQSSFSKGGRLVVYRIDDDLKQATTPYIGTRFRWLAPVGATDLDSDGHTEIAFVDRPHLAKTLRIWRYKNKKLTEIAALRGVSNHNIGEAFITGGIRECGSGPEMVMADAGWRRIVGVRFDGSEIKSRDLGAFQGQASVQRAMECR